MATMKRLAPLLLPLLLACGSSSEQNAHEQDNAARERAFHFSGGDTLAQRAAFDLNCPPNMMAAQVLQRAGMFAVAVAVGVRGCGRQTTYVRGPGTAGAWVLNGPVLADPAYQPPPSEAQPPPPPPPPAQ
jgi:hypothetical protein